MPAASAWRAGSPFSVPLLLARRLFALSALYSSFLTPSVAIGIALGLDGLQNAWITMHTVRVRARKKNLSEKFGLENHEEDPD